MLLLSSDRGSSRDQVSAEQWFHVQKQLPPSEEWTQTLAPCRQQEIALKKVTEMMGFLGVTGKRPLLYIGVGIVIQKELDHLLVARARAVKQSAPSSAVFQLQIGTLLSE